MAWRGLVISDETRVVRQGRGHVVGPWPARRPRYGFLEVGAFSIGGFGDVDWRDSNWTRAAHAGGCMGFPITTCGCSGRA